MADAARPSAASSTQSARPRPRFLAELVKVPSDNPPGDCAAHAERAAALLEGLGFAVERHPVPDELVRANGMIGATNLVVRRRFGDGPVVALNAHGDVVPPGEGWTKDPYGAEIVDGWMYGRGVAVSKSDFATYAFALLALEAPRAGAELAGTVELHLTYDEEVGGEIGPRLAARAGHQQARSRRRRGLLLRRRHRPQWLPAPRGAGRRPVGPRRHALDRRRRARGRDAHPVAPSTPGARRWPSGSRRSRASAARSSRSA